MQTDELRTLLNQALMLELPNSGRSESNALFLYKARDLQIRFVRSGFPAPAADQTGAASQDPGTTTASIATSRRASWRARFPRRYPSKALARGHLCRIR